MKITTTPTSFLVTAASYALDVSETSIAVILTGETVATLPPFAAVEQTIDDETAAPDKTVGEVTFAQVADTTEKAVFQWTAPSSLWEKKICTLTCLENRAEFAVTVRGSGKVDSVKYFLKQGGNDELSGLSHEFCQGFYPDVALGAGDGTYLPNGKCAIYSILSVPPMFYHSYRIAGIGGTLAFGAIAEAGEHNFSAFEYHVSHFRTNQDGHTVVNGEWTAPKIAIYTAEDHYDAGKKYCDIYFDTGIAKKGGAGVKPRFWYGPIACGWIEQYAFGNSPEGDGKILFSCKQYVYERMLKKLAEKYLHPQILIIDDKWQDNYGTAEAHPERWPDLRGFIDNNYKNGIHTFMWYRLWDSEGVPEEYCVWDETNGKYVCDPTNPGYQEILRTAIHRIISSDEGCYNAAGMKLDFAFWQPNGRKANTYSGKYGAELLREYIALIRKIAKEIKPDAVINASPCHPYFAELVDQARLHDYDSSSRNALEIFTHRAKLWGTANPNALIDTDSGGFNTHRDMMRFMKGQPKLGIPDLYCVSDLPNFAFTNDEWATIASIWREYGEAIDRVCE